MCFRRARFLPLCGAEHPFSEENRFRVVRRRGIHYAESIWAGTVFAEFDGHVVEYELRADQQIVVDTGYLAAMSASCGIEIQSVPGIKNMVFGGEGLFNTVITGPGHVWLQTMPLSNVAGVLRPYFPSSK